VVAGDHHGSIGFDDAASMRRATLQGIGVGLLSPHDAEADLRMGALVAPLGRDVLADMPEAQVPGFYLLVPRGHLRVQGVAALHRWMVAQDWGHDLLRPLPPHPVPAHPEPARPDATRDRRPVKAGG